MRNVIVSEFVSLDGVMQAPGGPEEDPAGGFEFGGWTCNYWDKMMGEVMDEAMKAPFDLLLGRKTYDIFAAHWPYAGDDPVAKTFNAAKKYVATSKSDTLTWQNSQALAGDVAQAVTKLRESDGPDLMVNGSSQFLQALVSNGLVDRYRLWVFPLVLGKGKKLFGSGAVPAGLKLLDSKVSTTGVNILTYEPAPMEKPGSFALETPADAEVERSKNLT
jgi:dihydrofolate reductase